MKIFNLSKKAMTEAAKVPDGVEYMVEYTRVGTRFQDIAINYAGEVYYKTRSVYEDAKTGQELDCYCRFDETGDYIIAVKCLDGSIEIH